MLLLELTEILLYSLRRKNSKKIMVDLPRKIMVKITKFKKRDHALFVTRVCILLDFADSRNLILSLRKVLPKNLV